MGARSHTHVFPYIEENPDGPLRNHKDTLLHARTATTSNSNVSASMHLLCSRHADAKFRPD